MKKIELLSFLRRWLDVRLFIGIGLIALAGCASSELPGMSAQDSDHIEATEASTASNLEQQNNATEKVVISQNSAAKEETNSQLAGPNSEFVNITNEQTDSVQLLEIPSQFRGTWNAQVENCSSVDDSRFIIYADKLRSYASAGPVTKIIIHSDSEITVTAEMTESGYPPFTSTHTYQLSEDRSELTRVANGMIWQRCPDE